MILQLLISAFGSCWGPGQATEGGIALFPYFSWDFFPLILLVEEREQNR